MTGVLNALVLTGSQYRTVTLGVNGSNAGFLTAVYGSINNASLLAASLNEITTHTSYDFLIDIDRAAGSVAQSFFRRIRVQDGAGAIRTFESSAATYSTPSGTLARWIWGNGSSRVWATTDNGETKIIEIVI